MVNKNAGGIRVKKLLALLFALLLSCSPVLPAFAETAQAPKKPTGVSATAIDKQSIMLTWNAKAGLTYELQRKSGGKWTKLAELAASPYLHTGLKTNTKYSYRLRAVSEGETSPYVTASAKTKNPVTSIKLKKTASVNAGATLSLKATLSPKKATDAKITWTSGNTDIVTVSSSGKVTAIKPGKVVITAASQNGKTASCTVTVKRVKVKSVLASVNYAVLRAGEAFTPSVTVQPQNATNKNVTYTVSNARVAEDENGVIVAKAAGSATLTIASEDNPGKTCTVLLRVIDETAAKRLEGLTIGVNPGHQSKSDYRLDPIAPGSKKKRAKVSSGAAGVSTRRPEYKVNLEIALILRDLLEAQGAKVVMSRTTNNVNISNLNRAKLFNKAKVDLALQLHCNSSRQRGTSGIVLYVGKGLSHSAESKRAAKTMLKAMVDKTKAKKRGVKTSSAYIGLNWSTQPSILVEMGYMSNAKEDKKLSTPGYQYKLAEGMAEGIALHFER